MINHKKYLNVRESATLVSYCPDYLARLARTKKVTAVQLGRRWYIQTDSLQAYVETQLAEQEIKQKHLRHARQQELSFPATSSALFGLSP